MDDSLDEDLFIDHLKRMFKGGRHCSSHTIRINGNIGAQGIDVDGAGGCALITEFQLACKTGTSCRRRSVIQLILRSLHRCKIPIICCGDRSIISMTPKGEPPTYAYMMEETLRRSILPKPLVNLILEFSGPIWFNQSVGSELPRSNGDLRAYSIKVVNKKMFRKIAPHQVTIIKFPFSTTPTYLEWSDDRSYLWVRGLSASPVICLVRWVRKRMKIPTMILEIGGVGCVLV
jgi:hypothetical protein